MPKVGTLGLDMMYRTCTVQINLDFSSEADMVKKLRVVARAAAGRDRAVRQLAVHRGQAERLPVVPLGDLARHRQRTAPACCRGRSSPGMGFERYVDYALDVPMYFVKRGDRYIDVAGQSFRDLMAGKLPGLPGERATMSDWANHVSTIFPEVRLKRYLEMRGADGGPWRRLPALPAFWVGLLYDDACLDAAWDLVKDWTAEERQKLRDDVPRLGLAGDDPRAQPARSGASNASRSPHEGLARRGRLDAEGRDETRYLEPLAEFVDRGRTPAEELLEKFHGPWRGSVEPIFDEYAL